MSDSNQISILAGCVGDLQNRVKALECFMEEPSPPKTVSRIFGYDTETPVGKRLEAAFLKNGKKGAYEEHLALMAEFKQLTREGLMYS